MSAAVITTGNSRINITSADVFTKTREAISKVVVDEFGRSLEDHELAYVHMIYIKYLENGCVERVYTEEEASAIGIYIVDVYGKAHSIMDIAKSYECAVAGISCEELCATAICATYRIGVRNDTQKRAA